MLRNRNIQSFCPVIKILSLRQGKLFFAMAVQAKKMNPKWWWKISKIVSLIFPAKNYQNACWTGKKWKISQWFFLFGQKFKFWPWPFLSIFSHHFIIFPNIWIHNTFYSFKTTYKKYNSKSKEKIWIEVGSSIFHFTN